MIWGFIGLLVIYFTGHFIGYCKGFKAGFKDAVIKCQEIAQSTDAPSSQMNGITSTSANPLHHIFTKF